LCSVLVSVACPCCFFLASAVPLCFLDLSTFFVLRATCFVSLSFVLWCLVSLWPDFPGAFLVLFFVVGIMAWLHSGPTC
jgi:hypothetical protein